MIKRGGASRTARILPLCHHKSIADGDDDAPGKGRSNDRSADIRTECIAGRDVHGPRRGG
jgi:hypothetical protein